MKSTFLKYTRLLLLALSGTLVLASCEKEDNETPEASSNPQANALQPGEGSANAVLTLTGSGLGDVRSIVFDNGNVPASFNPVFNTGNAVIFRVPDTANGGMQNIVFTNSKGISFQVPFKVIALATVSSASSTDFQSGTEITLTGNNLESVSKIVFEGTTDEVEILSKEKKKLVVRMPATPVNSGKLTLTNSSGVSTTTQTFVNVENAFAVFGDALHTNIENWSWSTNLSAVPENAITGTSALKAEYTGSWGGIQLHLKSKLDLAPYKRVAFWIKGADVDKKIQFSLDWNKMQVLNVPANVWTYFSFDLGIWKNAGTMQFDTFVMQIEGDPKTFYMDNIIFIR
ncbi:MAG TPA: IPT/TIG domain-containing protein [Chitinophagaceae bacterium]|jgi:hypothetical protein|nr:IPT/TIG domain-containing protein [Chitinophagaceae bacterium]